MKIDIRPNLDQIHFIARSAMHAWDHQDLEAGRAQVIADMQRLLAYLDALRHGEGVVVAGISGIKAGVRLERSTREGDSFDLTDRYVAEHVHSQVDIDNRSNSGVVVAENRVGMHDASCGADPESDLNL